MTETRSTPTSRDVVFTFFYDTYTDAVERGMMRPPDRLLSTLMTSDRVDRLLVANPFRRPATHAGRILLRKNAPFPRTRDHALVTPLRGRRSDPTGVDETAAEYERYDRALARTARRRGLASPALITTNPLVAGFAPLDWTSEVLYYARDDWASHPSYATQEAALRASYRAMADNGRPIAAVSQRILDVIEPTGPAEVVANGVEPSEWSGPRPAEPAWLSRIPHPRALYVGTLDTRLDVEGIADLARRRPDLHVILMGPLPSPEYLAPLGVCPNVHVHPSVGRAELVATMRNVDLCLLAHRRTPLTEAMSPLKVYEYLAAGCPVVSIDLPPVRDIDDRVILVDAVSDFADVIAAALDLGTAPEAERLAFVRDNSWASRHRVILDMVFRAR
ncbi:glycosyltransferase [Planctomonas psychrotolerans]|uniref:glycosyltransferase n=1 Tax=Planctomonas psychrotolerans TaxID=2528712 RepID=UPI001239B4DB|nr:glycosyltransferase [Planctomonas psychrotolerans]